MNTTDTANDDKTRGYILVSGQTSADNSATR